MVRFLAVIPPFLYDFGGLTTTPVTSQMIVIASRIDASMAESATLAVRVHSFTRGTGATDTIVVDAFPDGYTLDDPGTDFNQTGASLTNSVISLGTAPNTTAPMFIQAQLAVQFGGFIRIAITGNRNTLVAGNPLSAKVSIDLFLKTGGEIRGTGIQRAWGSYLGYGRGG